MFTLFGLIGQAIFNALDTRQPAASGSASANSSGLGSFWRSLGGSKWTPFTVLSDEDYEAMLKEKLLRVDAEIAMIDEKIEQLKQMPDTLDDNYTPAGKTS